MLIVGHRLLFADCRLLTAASRLEAASTPTTNTSSSTLATPSNRILSLRKSTHESTLVTTRVSMRDGDSGQCEMARVETVGGGRETRRVDSGQPASARFRWPLPRADTRCHEFWGRDESRESADGRVDTTTTRVDARDPQSVSHSKNERSPLVVAEARRGRRAPPFGWR